MHYFYLLLLKQELEAFKKQQEGMETLNVHLEEQKTILK